MKKLVDAGVHTVEGLARASRRQLSTVKGLSEQKVEKLKQIGASSSEARVRGVMRVDTIARRVGGATRGGTDGRARAEGTGAGFRRRKVSTPLKGREGR